MPGSPCSQVPGTSGEVRLMSRGVPGSGRNRPVPCLPNVCLELPGWSGRTAPPQATGQACSVRRSLSLDSLMRPRRAVVTEAAEVAGRASLVVGEDPVHRPVLFRAVLVEVHLHLEGVVAEHALDQGSLRLLQADHHLLALERRRDGGRLCPADRVEVRRLAEEGRVHDSLEPPVGVRLLLHLLARLAVDQVRLLFDVDVAEEGDRDAGHEELDLLLDRERLHPRRDAGQVGPRDPLAVVAHLLGLLVPADLRLAAVLLDRLRPSGVVEVLDHLGDGKIGVRGDLLEVVEALRGVPGLAESQRLTGPLLAALDVALLPGTRADAEQAEARRREVRQVAVEEACRRRLLFGVVARRRRWEGEPLDAHRSDSCLELIPPRALLMHSSQASSPVSWRKVNWFAPPAERSLT